MNHLLSQLQQSDVQYDLKAVVTDVLVDLHVIINGDINADQKNIDRKRCCKRYSFTVPFDGVDTPIILPAKEVREFAVDDHDPDVLEDESPDTDGMTAYESSSDDDADAHTMTPEDMQDITSLWNIYYLL
jgi:hypothetical protein